MWCIIIAFKTKTLSKFLYNCFNLFEKINFILMHEFFHFIGFNCGTFINPFKRLCSPAVIDLFSITVSLFSPMFVYGASASPPCPHWTFTICLSHILSSFDLTDICVVTFASDWGFESDYFIPLHHFIKFPIKPLRCTAS